jgi:hypothetical protein
MWSNVRVSKSVMNFIKTLHVWVGRGTGTPKDKDELNKREVCECEG